MIMMVLINSIKHKAIRIRTTTMMHKAIKIQAATIMMAQAKIIIRTQATITIK